MNSIRVGCAAIILDNDKILLGKRNKDPARGKWVLPGGKIKFLESLEQTLKREVKEELNINVKPIKQAGTFELIKEPDQHRVIIYYICKYVGGDIKPDDDISEAKFFKKEEIDKLIENGEITEFVSDVLRKVNLKVL